MRKASVGEGFTVTVAGNVFAASSGELKVRFSPDSKPHTASRLNRLVYPSGLVGFTWVDSLVPLTFQMPLSEQQIAERVVREKSVSGVELSGIVKPAVSLATGEMHEPMNSMRICIDELLSHWGLDAHAQRTLSQRVKPIDQGNWARVLQENYPRDMVAQGRGANVEIRLMVGADGRTTSCHTPIPSREPVFESIACEVMMKVSRFEPALDSGGRPIASLFVTSAVFDPN